MRPVWYPWVLKDRLYVDVYNLDDTPYMSTKLHGHHGGPPALLRWVFPLVHIDERVDRALEEVGDWPIHKNNYNMHAMVVGPGCVSVWPGTQRDGELLRKPKGDPREWMRAPRNSLSDAWRPTEDRELHEAVLGLFSVDEHGNAKSMSFGELLRLMEDIGIERLEGDKFE